jgi:hypothetical protein
MLAAENLSLGASDALPKNDRPMVDVAELATTSAIGVAPA